MRDFAQTDIHADFRKSHAMTNRFETVFTRLAQKHEGAFVPFVNLCDPDEDTSLAILETLVASGADALELGIPFSDPSADGPVVEASADRALQNGATPARCLEIMRRFRAAHPETPVSLMLYINLVAAPGLSAFMQAAADAGADAVLIPDLPSSMREAEPEWDEAARAAGLHLIAIVPPNADDARVRRIAGLTGGYTYLLSRVGITGTDHASGTPAARIIRDLADAKAPPALLGFGISTPEHVRRALEAGAAGVIVGSALVKIIAEHLHDKTAMLEALGKATAGFKAATRG